MATSSTRHLVFTAAATGAAAAATLALAARLWPGTAPLEPHPLWLPVFALAALHGFAGLVLGLPAVFGAAAALARLGLLALPASLLASTPELGALAAATLVAGISAARERHAARLVGALEGRAVWARHRLTGWLVTFGRVPLFFYVLQWTVAHAMGIALGLLAGQSVAHLFRDLMESFTSPPPQDVGFGLPVVYAAWIVGLLLLYPLCRWYAGVKARRKDLTWLSYL